jgi:hypothetical protein
VRCFVPPQQYSYSGGTKVEQNRCSTTAHIYIVVEQSNVDYLFHHHNILYSGGAKQRALFCSTTA